MDPIKFLQFVGQTPEEKKNKLEQERVEEKMKTEATAITAMVKSKGFKITEEWLMVERDRLKTKLHLAVKAGNDKEAVYLSAKIDAIHSLFNFINKFLVG